jgi:hypothetical protein
MMRVASACFLVVTLVSAVAQADHPESAEARAERLRQAEVVVVTGSADHMEQVLRRAQVKFVVVTPDELPQLPLHGQQVLMVNCTGEMSAAARERVRRFVTAGGFLYTTDHAVQHLVEKAFPGFIRYNNKTTNEEIFPMQVSGERGLLKHIGGAQGHPRWQVASGGFLFDVVDAQRVEVLMSSSAVAARYHSSPLGVRFKVGDGQVIHVTGHFFTQPGQRPEVAAAGQAFEQLSSNVVAEKKEDQSRIDRLYNVAPKRPVMMQAAPEAAAPSVAPASGVGSVSTSSRQKVRVLDRSGDYAHVRDAEGNEGYVPANSL